MSRPSRHDSVQHGIPVLARRLATGGLMGCALISIGCAGDRDTHTYVERLGIDTVSVESYTRTADGFRGDVTIRSPSAMVAHYEASLTPEGTISRMQVDWSTPAENPDGRPPIGYTYTLDGDSATVELRRGTEPTTARIAVPPAAIPLVGKTPVAYAVLEQAVRQAIASGSDVYPAHYLSVVRGRVVSTEIVRISPDSLSFGFFGSPFLVEVDADGRILGRSGEQTTMKVVGERVNAVDIATLAADFASRDARGEGMGVASPLATVDATLDGAALNIRYSQPARRGREIWGGLVPWDEVWRTGANAATAFSTDRDLEIGGAAVPAGDYTLFSIYTADSAQLIINRQTEQWGTQYDQEQDLVRVDLARESLAEGVERFTISIEAAEEGGALRLDWDTTRFSVPIRVM
jgi:hypothetical protein